MAETPVRIIATGLFTPPNAISNEELVESFNAYVAEFNAENAAAIEAGEMEPLSPSSAEFIEKASGIKSRFVLNKDGILDTKKMRPSLPERPNEELSVMAEMGVIAAREALKSADLTADDIDAVICAASNMQRAYPAMAVEVQSALGVGGFAFDMNVACASAAFGVEAGMGLIRNGAKRVLMVNPEICSGHLNFRDRDSHFIFGDVATAMILERAEGEPTGEAWDILDTRMKTVFSNNIRNNFGFLNRAAPEGVGQKDKLFVQEGRKVFKDVVPMVGEMISEQIAENGLEATQLRRMWLHQANLNMNVLIAKKVLGRDATLDDAPVVLDRYANTSSAGSIISFHLHRDGVEKGEYGVICGFGAGYSAGSVLVKRAA